MCGCVASTVSFSILDAVEQSTNCQICYFFLDILSYGITNETRNCYFKVIGVMIGECHDDNL